MGQRPAPTAFGFRGWLALTKADGGQDFTPVTVVRKNIQTNENARPSLQKGEYQWPQ
jgi:hypothetical protein